MDFSTRTAKEMAKEARKNLSEGILLAKSRWSSKLADRIHDMANYPKDAWKAVFTLMEWLQGHHKTPNIFRLQKKDNSFTETDSEVVELLSKYFHSVYNRKIDIDWKVLNNIEDKPKLKYLDVPMSFYEFKEAINELVLHKAPGLNGVSPNAIKALNHDNKKSCLKYVLTILTIRLKLRNGKLVILKYYQKKEIYPNRTTGEVSICYT